MDDILKEFLVESHEHLDRMERDLVTLEKAPDDDEALARVFRAVHTIKGTCGFFGLPRLESLTHAGENVLTKLLGREMRFRSNVADVLLRLVDAVRGLLAVIEETGEEGDVEVGALTDELKRFAAEAPVEDVNAPEPDREPEPAIASPARVATQTVRLDVAVLDELMNLVGELVLARNHIQEFGHEKEAPIAAATQQLSRITAELQETVMQARMEPVGRLWNRFPRVVRDLAAVFGKAVRIEMRGRATELDRTVLETIADPLTHLVRNSLDHGIESPSVRQLAGKPEEGELVLSAYHEAGHVVMEVRDDGAGVDPGRIRRIAVQRGVISAAEAEELTEAEVRSLIFRPGFSTAQEVTSVSGRGVGMDVVKSNVERVGGTIDLESRVGRGTTVRIKLPLTLAIIPAVVVRSAGLRFVIPQSQLRELIRLAPDQRIELVHEAPVCRLRGRLLPLVSLADVLGLEEAYEHDSIHIAVVETEERRFGLMVDRILDAQETVVKPLGLPLERIPTYAGGTILGDGTIALILDVGGIASRAGLAGESDLPAWEEEVAPPKSGRTRRFLFVQGPDDGRMVLPMDEIVRLEEFPLHRVERAGTTAVVQYRDRILPLVHVSDLLGDRRRKARYPRVLDTVTERGALQVAVHERRGRELGLILDRIIDVVELDAKPQKTGGRAGVLGTVLVHGRVAEYLDIEHFVAAAPAEAGE